MASVVPKEWNIAQFVCEEKKKKNEIKNKNFKQVLSFFLSFVREFESDCSRVSFPYYILWKSLRRKTS